MLACLSIQFMPKVVINESKPHSLVTHIIKRIGTLFQETEKHRHSITIRERSCCLFLIGSIQNGWKHLWQENFVAFVSITYAWIFCFYTDNCLEFALYIRKETHVAQSGLYCSLILTEPGYCRQILLKTCSIDFDILLTVHLSIKKKLRGLSPRANYSDRAAAAGRRLVPTFADRGVSRGQRNGSPRPLISVFWTGAATFYSSSSSIDLTRLSGARSRPTTTQKIW